MARLTSVRVEVAVRDLLSAIWYYDGSGARINLGLDMFRPEDFTIREIAVDKGTEMVRIHLIPRDAEEQEATDEA